MKKDEVIFLIIAIVVAGIILVNISSADTILGVITDQIYEPEWDKLKPRDIIKNTVLIQVLERNGNCLVSAEKLNLALDHQDFIYGEKLGKELNYDRKEKTINISCDKLIEDEMNLHIWIVIPEAPKYADRFTYFITDSSVGVSDATIPK